MKQIVKRTLIGGAMAMMATVGLGAAYIHSLDLDSQQRADAKTTPADLPFLRHAAPATRGRILAIVTSTAKADRDRIPAGLELTELARAYYTFRANGFAVEIASPQGGKPPVTLDEDLVEADYAFINDPEAQRLLANTIPLAAVDPARYAAVYFVGGKGAMFDFPNNVAATRIASAIYGAGGVIGAVCHGPAALLAVRGPDGRGLLEGRRVTGFTNREELFLISNAREVFPFLLQDALTHAGATFVEGPMYLDHTIVDDRVVTGQNPWSTWSVAEGMVRSLGYQPVHRDATGEEIAVRVLDEYHRRGQAAAARLRGTLPNADKRLILMHALIAAMEARPWTAYQIQRLIALD
jgi:putative intracellular protease/amidase